MSKLKLTDDPQTMLIKMTEGNPGAIVTLIEVMKVTPQIDPQSAFREVSAVFALDTLGIYGSDIYVLFNDKCNRDPRTFLMLLRANQLGFIPAAEIKNMAADQFREVNITTERLSELDKKVCDQLSQFARKEG